MPYFSDPAYGWGQPQYSGPDQLAGALGGQQAGVLGAGQPQPSTFVPFGQPAAPRPSPLAALSLALSAGIAGGRGGIEAGLNEATQNAQYLQYQRKRMALNAWLKAKSSGDKTALDQATQNLYAADPAIAENVATAAMVPRPLVAVAPGARMADPITGKFADGGAGAAAGRGDGSTYDLEQASKAYKTQYGEGANTAVDAPDVQWWYKNRWPTYGLGGSDQGAGSAGASGSSDNSANAGGVPLRGATDQSLIRQERISSNIAKPIMDSPVYKLVSTGGPYLSRIEAAAKAAAVPGANKSVLDNEILDSLVKLNTGGGQVTEANVNLITHGGALTDKINVFKNYMQGQGGVLSDAQRNEALKLSREVFRRYQEGYKPFYDQYTQKMKLQKVPPESWTLPDVEKLSSMGGMGESSGGGGGAQEGDVAVGPGGHQIMVKDGRWVDAQTGQPIQ